MKVQAINHTNFSGLYTDKSEKSNGYWRKEYSPYSWESSNTSQMAGKEKFDICAFNLPDNEEIYKNYGRREESRDILGTVSYYRNFYTDQRGKSFIRVPAMNREESLKIHSRKLGKFLEMKAEYKAELEKLLAEEKAALKQKESERNKASQTDSTGFWGWFKNKKAGNTVIDTSNISGRLSKNTVRYIVLCDSIEEVKNMREKELAEAQLLKQARENNNLIDISRRDIKMPDNPLIEGLKDIKTAIYKIVALPHRTISVKEIIEAIGQRVKSGNVTEEALKYVGELIKTCK